MKNGIVINDRIFKAVNCLSTGLTNTDPCTVCDLTKICAKSGCQYPCDLFKKKDHLVHFKEIKK